MTLSREVQMHNDDFTEPAKLAEMLNRISKRSGEIRAEIRALSAPPSPQAQPADAQQTAKKPAPAGKQTTQDKAAADRAEEAAKEQALAKQREEANAKREERNARIDFLVPQCLTMQERERTAFAKANKEMDSWFKSVATVFDILNTLKKSWPEWDSMVDQLRAVYQERGESPARANQFAPNKDMWNQINSRALK
jgi:hypothetical protein